MELFGNRARPGKMNMEGDPMTIEIPANREPVLGVCSVDVMFHRQVPVR
jgi:hypothetical protein